jgi:GDP-L-fucose synthase
MNLKFFNNKKIVVTGGTGLIGAKICNYLSNTQSDVISVSIDSQERVKEVLSKPEIHRNIDLRNFDNCLNLFKGADIVMNLMGIRESTQLGVKKSATAMSAFLICNTNIIQASCINNVNTYLFCGSINEYPPLELRHEDDLWKGLPSANDKYVGISKRVGELQAEAYSNQFNWNAVKIVRPSNVYGPFDNFDPETAHVIPSLIHKIFNSNNGELNVAGDGKAVRDFIYIDDLVEGILNVVEKGDINLPFNLGSGIGVSIREVVETIIELTNVKLKIIWDTNLPTGDNKRILDISRAKEKINFKPKHSLSEGIKKTIEWYLKNKDLAYKYGRTYDKKYKI